jgi:hypothetical protein
LSPATLRRESHGPSGSPEESVRLVIPRTKLPGVLERTREELVLRDEAAVVYAIEWPRGTAVKETSEGLAVVDEVGTVKAREGDSRPSSGWRREGNTWNVCGTIEVVPSSS